VAGGGASYFFIGSIKAPLDFTEIKGSSSAELSPVLDLTDFLAGGFVPAGFAPSFNTNRSGHSCSKTLKGTIQLCFFLVFSSPDALESILIAGGLQSQPTSVRTKPQRKHTVRRCTHLSTIGGRGIC